MLPDSPNAPEAGPLRAMADRLDPRDAGAFNNLGVLYASRGMYVEALDVLLHAVTLDPRMRTAMRNLEIVAAAPGAIARRIEELSARLDLDPGDRRARLERARLDRVTGYTADAIHMLDGLIAENPEDGDALFERGLIEQRIGDLRRAEQWFARAVQSGTQADARLYLAEVLYQRGLNEQALDELDRHLQEAADHAEAHRVRAFVLGDLGRLDEAQDAARMAASLNPSLDAIEPNLMLANSGIPTPVAAVAIRPADAPTHVSLGLAFRQRGYLVEARREFELARSHGEDPLRTLHALAELDLVSGEPAAAQARLELLLLEQEQPRWWTEHGVAQHQAGHLDGAIDSYQRALRLDPRHAIAWNNLGVALAARQDHVAAVEALRRAIELDGTLAVGRANLERLEAASMASNLHALEVFIEFKRECPLAVGGIDLLRYGTSDAAPVAPHVEEPVEKAVEEPGEEPVQELDEQPGEEPVEVIGEHSEASRDAETMAPPTDPPDAGPVETAPDWLDEPADVLCVRADDLLAAGRREEALTAYRAARAADEDALRGPASLWHRAATGEVRALCLLDRAGEALPLVRLLMLEEPEDPELLVCFAAGVVAERGFPGMQAARMALRRLLSQDGPSAALLHFAGDVAQRIHDETLALTFYRRALALDPTRPTPRVEIARVLRRRGDRLAAHLELVAALAVAPDLGDAVRELARLHHEAGHHAKARTLLVAHLERHPADEEALLVFVEVLVAETRYAEARRVVDRLRLIAPHHPGGVWFDGWLLDQEGQSREAVARWAVLALDPEAEPWAQRARQALARALDAVEHAPVSLTLHGVA